LFVAVAACSSAPAPSAPAPSPSPPAATTPSADDTTAAEPQATATPAAIGELTVNVTEGWGEVWLDGERVTDETPLNAWETTAGEHAVRVVNPESGAVLYDGPVEVRPNVMIILHLDGRGGHNVEIFDN
jgi:hypothetical protein